MTFPIVMIHAFPLSHKAWAPQVEVLSKTCRVIAYDIRGFGKTEAGDLPYTLETYVDDLIRLLDDLKLPQAILCGLSMGGYIALRAHERHPDRVSGLVLCDTKSEADTNEAKIKRAAAIQGIKQKGLATFAEVFLRSVLTEDTLRSKPQVCEALSAMIRANSPAGVCAALVAMAARTDTTASLSKIKVPTLILVGEHDKLTPPAAAEAMAKAIPGSVMHVIPGAAHMSNLENPAVFNEKLLQFLQAGIKSP